MSFETHAIEDGVFIFKLDCGILEKKLSFNLKKPPIHCEMIAQQIAIFYQKSLVKAHCMYSRSICLRIELVEAKNQNK